MNSVNLSPAAAEDPRPPESPRPTIPQPEQPPGHDYIRVLQDRPRPAQRMQFAALRILLPEKWPGAQLRPPADRPLLPRLGPQFLVALSHLRRLAPERDLMHA